MRHYDWTEWSKLICEKAAIAAYGYRIDNEKYNFSIGPFGDPRESGRQLGVRVQHLVQAAEEVLPGHAKRYLKGIKTWEQLPTRLVFMHKGMSLFGGDPGGRPFEDKFILRQLQASVDALKRASEILHKKTKATQQYKASAVGWEHWDFCPFCWRIAPRVKRKKTKPGRCSIHAELNSAETQRARRLKSYVPPQYIELANASQLNAFNIEFEKVFTKANSLLLPSQKVLDCSGYRQIDHPTPSFDPYSIPLDEQNIKNAWLFFNNTAEYAFKNGADLNNFLSVVKTLDDAPDPTGTRDKIHIAFSRAPSLAKSFLINAETWLRLESQERRGGKREKTGGKQPGAGRPKRAK